MKKTILVLSLACASLHGWTFNQKIELEEKARETALELGESLKQSSENIAHSITLMSEKGIYSLPWNVNEDVWKNMRELTYLIAFISLGWILVFFGIIHTRKNLVFIKEPRFTHALKELVSPLAIILSGTLIMFLAHPLARLISTLFI